MWFHRQLWLFWTARSTVFWGIFNWLRDSPTFTWTRFSPSKAGFTPMVSCGIFNWLRDYPTFAWTCCSPSKAGCTPMAIHALFSLSIADTRFNHRFSGPYLQGGPFQSPHLIFLESIPETEKCFGQNLERQRGSPNGINDLDFERIRSSIGQVRFKVIWRSNRRKWVKFYWLEM